MCTHIICAVMLRMILRILTRQVSGLYSGFYAHALNGPYSLLVRTSYFISCSVYARSTSVIFIVCKWHWGVGITSRISMPCSKAIGLIIR